MLYWIFCNRWCNGATVQSVVQCLHDVTAFGVMDIWWCKNCTKLKQKIVCNLIKKTNISHSNTYINLKLHLWSSMYHDTIYSWDYYTTYALHNIFITSLGTLCSGYVMSCWYDVMKVQVDVDVKWCQLFFSMIAMFDLNFAHVKLLSNCCMLRIDDVCVPQV